MIVQRGNPIQMDFPVYDVAGFLRDDLDEASRIVFMVKVDSEDPDADALISKELYPYVSEVLFEGNGGSVPDGVLEHFPIIPGTLSITDGVETFSDDGEGVLTGSLGGLGSIDYTTGVYSVTFLTNPIVNVEAVYGSASGPAIFVNTPKVGRVRVILSSVDTDVKLGEYVFALQVEWGSEKVELTLGGGCFKVVSDVIR